MLLSPEELKKTAEIDPQILEFAQKNPSPPPDWDDAAAMKAGLEVMETATLVQLGPPEKSLVEEERQIPMTDGFESAIKIHRPAETPSGGSPLFVLMYGGGWISGTKDQLTPISRAVVRLYGAVVVNISYRLGPTYKWPIPSSDAWDSTKWIAEHAAELHADPSKGFIIGGVSAGAGNSATVTNMSILAELNPPITGQWLGIPGIMDEAHVPEKYKKYFLSREHNKDAPVLPVSALEALQKHAGWVHDSPGRFPILFESQVPFSKLPPTFFSVDGMDPLRDDSLIYDELLKEAGVKTRLDLYPGCPHGHWGFMPGIEVSNRAVGDILVGLGWLLGKELSREEAFKSLAPAS